MENNIKMYDLFLKSYGEYEFYIQDIKNNIKNIINDEDKLVDVDFNNEKIDIYVKPNLTSAIISKLDDYMGLVSNIEAVNRNGKKLWLKISYSA